MGQASKPGIRMKQTACTHKPCGLELLLRTIGIGLKLQEEGFKLDLKNVGSKDSMVPDQVTGDFPKVRRAPYSALGQLKSSRFGEGGCCLWHGHHGDCRSWALSLGSQDGWEAAPAAAISLSSAHTSVDLVCLHQGLGAHPPPEPAAPLKETA